MKHEAQKKNKGFTLIELLVAMAIFTVCMVAIMGAVLSVLTINRKEQSSKTAMDNLNSALESMSRTIRFSTNFHCGSGGNINSPTDCAAGASSLTVLDAAGERVTYALSNGVLTRSVNSGTALAMTSPEVSISTLAFRVFGSYPFGTCNDAPISDCLEPQIIITVTGTAGSANKAVTQSTFRLETTVSERKPDM